MDIYCLTFLDAKTPEIKVWGGLASPKASRENAFQAPPQLLVVPASLASLGLKKYHPVSSHSHGEHVCVQISLFLRTPVMLG